MPPLAAAATRTDPLLELATAYHLWAVAFDLSTHVAPHVSLVQMYPRRRREGTVEAQVG